MTERQWIPLESNPQVLTKYGHVLGLSPLLSFCDVWSLELLDMVPSPRFAVILLFPLTQAIESASAPSSNTEQSHPSSSPFFCKQTIGNACGTIALLHAVLNANVPAAPPTPDSFFERFQERTHGMSGAERAVALQEDQSLDSVHEQFAQEGQTAAPPANEKVGMHFVCFVERDGILYELDGRKEGAVAHGSCSRETLLEDAAKVIRENFMSLDPEEHRFTIMALTMNVE